MPAPQLVNNVHSEQTNPLLCQAEGIWERLRNSQRYQHVKSPTQGPTCSKFIRNRSTYSYIGRKQHNKKRCGLFVNNEYLDKTSINKKYVRATMSSLLKMNWM